MKSSLLSISSDDVDRSIADERHKGAGARVCLGGVYCSNGDGLRRSREERNPKVQSSAKLRSLMEPGSPGVAP